MELMQAVSVGDRARTPVVFGNYEVGRTSYPLFPHQPTAPFKDTTPKESKLELTGDPGRYDPWAHEDRPPWAHGRVLGHSKNRKSFDSTEFRKMSLQIGETCTAPPATHYDQNAKYSLGRPYAAVDSQRSVFCSGSLQRPTSRSFVPGAGTYSPNMNAVYRSQRDSGAPMRSLTGRFGSECVTTPRNVGPGRYNSQFDRTLYEDAQKSVSRASRIRPGFGSTSLQRELPCFRPRDTPSPGEHQPSLPRTPRRRQRPLTARV